ncbi:hypothetical protein Poli38472_005731 [Pythium oligandrum]|uniref:Poly(A) RNA polymerase mitochondrial-like central palm domain-containing protein n=1 Tax=Pythium oligandrum TaxID=41045 RepID=A0A8K1FS66_PYTOL|nr:hypothetical protein Poli38472_005731 [Pythium oligandrum]|eukprot:TMW68263.1 hypothetical protein Poli38472_005731 [Pythium oligandrum]
MQSPRRPTRVRAKADAKKPVAPASSASRGSRKRQRPSVTHVVTKPHGSSLRKHQKPKRSGADGYTKPAAASRWQPPDSEDFIPFGATSRPSPGFPRGPKQSLTIRTSTPTLSNKKKNRKKRKLAETVGSTTTTPASSRATLIPLPKLSMFGGASSDLDAEIMAFARFVSLTDEERAFRNRIFYEIKHLILAVFPGAHVKLYGSSSSGLETFRSDLDITVGGDLRVTASLGEIPDVSSAVISDEDDSASDHVVEDSDEDEETSFSLNLAIPGASMSIGNNGGQPVRRAASAPNKSPWNPTLRREKLRQLRLLQQLLNVHRPDYRVKCLPKARIPILMVEDPQSGVSIDIGVNRESFQASDHGRTTALVTDLQSALGPMYIAVVVFLKEFLHQFELDKPFTGGLGSYRLYMMVAYIFTARVSRKAPTLTPSRMLLMFLEVFGNRQKPGFLSSTLELPVRLGNQRDVVDFASIFRLDDCVEKFAMGFDIISKFRSLGHVLYEDRLQKQREASLRRIFECIQAREQAARRQDDVATEIEDDDDSVVGFGSDEESVNAL